MMFKNINLNINYSEEFFRVLKQGEYLELFRQNKHCLHAPLQGENRWVYFPIKFKLTKGKKYVLEFEVFSTYSMKRTFFLFSNNKTQVFDLPIASNVWVKKTFNFKSELEGDASFIITATDLPIASHRLLIKHLSISE